MNSKGSFSAIVGVALIVLIASIGFTYYASGNSQKALLEQSDALEVRQHFTQVRLLLDKAAAKALWDSKTAFCAHVQATYENKSRTYFQDVLNASNDSVVCTLPNLAIMRPSNGGEYSTLLVCEKPGSASYSVTVKFKKSLRTLAPCSVWDIQGSTEFQELP